MNKTFGELSVGDRFLFNNQEFVKTNEVRISCCRTVNASAASDSNNTVYIQPTTIVTTVTNA